MSPGRALHIGGPHPRQQPRHKFRQFFGGDRHTTVVRFLPRPDSRQVDGVMPSRETGADVIR
jgi:hypothetical protein